MNEQLYRIEYMEDPEAEGACMACNTDGVKYVPVDVGSEAVRNVLVNAMMHGNDVAAYNSGASRDYYESEVGWVVEDLAAALGADHE